MRLLKGYVTYIKRQYSKKHLSTVTNGKLMNNLHRTGDSLLLTDNRGDMKEMRNMGIQKKLQFNERH